MSFVADYLMLCYYVIIMLDTWAERVLRINDSSFQLVGHEYISIHGCSLEFGAWVVSRILGEWPVWQLPCRRCALGQICETPIRL